MVGVPIGTDEYVLERAMGVMKDGGADRLAPCLANMPGMQAAAPITINSLGQRTSYLEKAPDTRLSLEACRRADNGAQRAYQNPSRDQEQRRHSHFSRRGARGIS